MLKGKLKQISHCQDVGNYGRFFLASRFFLKAFVDDYEMVLFLANVLRYLFCNHDDDKNMCTFNIRLLCCSIFFRSFFCFLSRKDVRDVVMLIFGGIKIC